MDTGTIKRLFVALGVLAILNSVPAALGQYSQWKHTGSLYIITTPEGANLPAGASEKDFPLLVRLNKDFFDFAQAQPEGQDIRFSTPAGTALHHQIEQWDAKEGIASIWVRIPVIKGAARQEIKMHWGNAAIKSESNGKAVFDKANGHLAVWHMNGPVTNDEVGEINPKDTGTTASAGIIGEARHFPGGKGVFCGDDISTFPTGSQPHSSSVWFRGGKPNCRVLSWGKEYRQGKVQMWYRSPSNIRMDCYFSDADVSSSPVVPLNTWVHVVHTYRKGESRLYVNGTLDAIAEGGTPLSIERPARMWIGGWYNNYDFLGDVDEVRISGVARSADWVRLEYENQKTMHTLVGPVVPDGHEFRVSKTSLTLNEGEAAILSARAGGAQKIYWILKQNKHDSIVAVDRLAYRFDPGRITGNKNCTLQFKAIFPNQVKTSDIPITIKEHIPDPVFALRAPSRWNGRDAIEVVPRFSNLTAMAKAGAGDLAYKWSVSGGAVIKKVAPGKLILKRSQCSNTITVNLAVNNGGKDVTAATSIDITEPEKDPWIRRVPGRDEKPQDFQFYPRDDKNQGTLHCNGTLDHPADAVFIRVYADNKLFAREIQKLKADKSYAFAVTLKPGLIKYKVEFGSKTDTAEKILHKAVDIVCGDAYIIEGQSNALATDTREESPRDYDYWIRSYGHASSVKLDEPYNLWCNPVWKFGKPHKECREKHKAVLGWWGMELAKRLLKSHKVPICIINGAKGGTRIDQHQRNETDPTDLKTIYGQLLWRVRDAKLTHGIRAVIWHQGESDQGARGPTPGFGWETYQQYFLDMSADWKEDFPNIRQYYIFQIWPNSCSMGGNGTGDMIREKQRTLPRLYSNMDVMSTLGIKPPGPCHYPLKGWSEFARLLQPLIDRDFYGSKPAGILTPPDLTRAYYTSDARDTIALEFDQPIVWKDSLVSEFRLDKAKGQVTSGSVSGNVLTLKLRQSVQATTITYLDEMSWSQDRLIIGTNGIAALTFCNVPISPPKASP